MGWGWLLGLRVWMLASINMAVRGIKTNCDKYVSHLIIRVGRAVELIIPRLLTTWDLGKFYAFFLINHFEGIPIPRASV